MAGSLTDSTSASYDDNEMTDWYNDGQLSTAWIEYELERPALVSAVNLKLNNFRSKSYPLRITVDGQEVFRGSSEKSLGYFLAACKPVRGTKVRIELMNATEVQQTGGTELSGKKLDDGVSRDDAGAKGRLSIIEVEIYEAN